MHLFFSTQRGRLQTAMGSSVFVQEFVSAILLIGGAKMVAGKRGIGAASSGDEDVFNSPSRRIFCRIHFATLQMGRRGCF